tara:strand:- start:49 stop:534 length:486 start_codon:yes stop_codon:yes gene_type:complete
MSEYYQLLEDDFEEQQTEKILEDRYGKLSKDGRPSIGKPNPEFGKIITKTENEKAIFAIRKSEKEQIDSKKTIMDMPLKDIIEKTSEVTGNFWDDYKVKLSEIEINEKLKDKDYHKSWASIIKIHTLAMVEYLKNDNNCLYIGILLVIISVIIYLFNITRK